MVYSVSCNVVISSWKSGAYGIVICHDGTDMCFVPGSGWKHLDLEQYRILGLTIVLIDVSLSPLFVFLLHHISLFAILSVNSRAYAHPLHECSKYLKGVDQIDLYLASGLGTSQDKIPKKTKCETLVD